jgi:hypothetical protein
MNPLNNPLENLFLRPYEPLLYIIFALLCLAGSSYAVPHSPLPGTGDEFHFYNSAAPDTTITGNITDSAGAPLSGVSVLVKGSNKGTFTNASGNFSLADVSPNATLVISNIGYQDREIILSPGQTLVNVALSSEVGTLAEVVVTGFQLIDKKKFTGAAVTLDVDDVKIQGQTDVTRMLEGRAAGVSVQNVSSTFGTAPKVRVRGATSINGDNKPLWVVDGVVLEDIINISNSYKKIIFSLVIFYKPAFTDKVNCF